MISGWYCGGMSPERDRERGDADWNLNIHECGGTWL